VDTAEAKLRSQATVALVGDVVPACEIDDVGDRLHAEYEPLFEFVGADEDGVPW